MLSGIPELVVGIVSIFKGIPEISIGDILASNLSDISIVVLIPSFIAGKLSLKGVAKTSILYMLSISGIVMTLFLLLGSINRFAGLLLIVFYFFSIHFLWRQNHISELIRHETDPLISSYNVKKNLLKLSGSMLIVILSGGLVVTISEFLATQLGVFSGMIGALVISLGTSLPELSVGINAARRGSTDLAIGSAVGSVFSQALLVLGVVATCSSTAINLRPFLTVLPFVLMLYGYFGYRIYKSGEIRFKDSIVLVSIYLVFYISHFIKIVPDVLKNF